MKKNISLIIVVALLVGLLAGCTSPASNSDDKGNGGSESNVSSQGSTKDKIVIKLSHGGKTGSARDLGCMKTKEVIESMTDGRVEVQIYPSSQLGAGTDLIQGMQTGNVEMVLLPTSYLSSFQPLTTLMDIPYLFPSDYEQLVEIEQGPAGQALMDTTEEFGVITLDIWHTGYKAFTANSPLENPDDFKGLKFRVMPSSIQMAQYEALGATAVTMDFNECYNALAQGAIDGQENPLDTIADMNFDEVQKYCVESRHGVLDQFMMVSKVWYEGLDSDIQEAIVEGIKAGREVALEETLKSVEAAREKIEGNGCTIIELSDTDIEVWKEALSSVRENYISDNGEKGKELLELFETEVDRFRQ